MWMFRPFSCGTFGSGGIVLMSSGTNVFGSSCANRTRYSTPPARSNAIWMASQMDWFTLFGVPFARPPQRVPLSGLVGIVGPRVVREVSKPDGAAAAEGTPGRSGTPDVMLLSLHYFVGNSSLNLRSLPTNCADRTYTPLFPLGSAPPKHGNSIRGIRGIPQAKELGLTQNLHVRLSDLWGTDPRAGAPGTSLRGPRIRVREHLGGGRRLKDADSAGRLGVYGCACGCKEAEC